jgi:ankyrin repeat protein
MSSKRNDELLRAIEAGDVDRIKKYLLKGASADVKDNDKQPILHTAVAGNPIIVELLLAAGASVNQEDKAGDTALLRVLNRNYSRQYRDNPEDRERISSIVKALLESGAKFNVVGSGGWIAIQKAAAYGHVGALKHLLAVGAGANDCANSHRTETALQYAATSGIAECTEILIAAGGNVNVANTMGWTPLMSAVCAVRSADSVKLLLAAGSAVNARSKSGDTALMWAAHSGNAAAVDVLLAAGADVNATSNIGRTPLMFAVMPPEFDYGEDADPVSPQTMCLVTTKLITNGATVSAIDSSGKTALSLAHDYCQLDSKYLDVVRLLETSS